MKLRRAVFGTLVIVAALSGCNRSPTAIAPPAHSHLDENGTGFGSGNRTSDPITSIVSAPRSAVGDSLRLTTPRLDENGGGFGSGNRTLEGAGTATGTASKGFPTQRDSLVMTAN